LIWHLVNGHPAGSPREISSRADVDKIAFGGGSNLLAVGYTDGTIRLWNPTTGHPVGHLFQVDAISDMAFSPTGKILATTGSYSQPDDGTVELWDPTTGRPFAGTFQTGAGSHGGVRELAFSLRGGLLAVTDNDGTVEQWDTLTGHSSALYEINPRRATIGAAFSPGGQLVACALNSFGGVVFWDLVTGRPAGTELRSGHQEGIQGVAFSSDGKLVATSGEGTMLWNRANGQSVGHFLPSSSETAVAFSPHSQLLATAGDHGTVQLWNSATERSVRTFQTGSQDTVHEVAFSPDGTLLASADSDGTVRMWNTVTGHPVGLPIPAGSDLSSGVSALAFTPDGTLLATVSGAVGTVRLWNVSLFANPYAALCADAGPPTRQEWNQYAPGEPPAKACS
jgi:WD40 repeat protein